MRLFLLLGITLIFSNSSYSQSEIITDTIYSEKGEIQGYGKMKKDKRIGTWYFNGEQEGEYWYWTYLGDSMLYSRHYFDNKIGTISYASLKDTVYVKTGVYCEFYKGEYLQSMRYYSDDKLNGSYFEYYPSQSIKKQRFYENDTLQGIAIDYYENGMIESQGNIVNGAKSGKWNSYYLNGDLKSEGNYIVVNTDKVDLNEISEEFYDSWITPNLLLVKDGCWKYYSENGKIIQEDKYEQGTLVKQKNH